MSLYTELINGNGVKDFGWEVATYKGDNETETIAHYDTYIEALQFKVRHKDCTKLFIDLWRYNESEIPTLIGDNFLEIKNYLEKTCISKNIVLSL